MQSIKEMCPWNWIVFSLTNRRIGRTKFKWTNSLTMQTFAATRRRHRLVDSAGSTCPALATLPKRWNRLNSSTRPKKKRSPTRVQIFMLKFKIDTFWVLLKMNPSKRGLCDAVCDWPVWQLARHVRPWPKSRCITISCGFIFISFQGSPSGISPEHNA